MTTPTRMILVFTRQDVVHSATLLAHQKSAFPFFVPFAINDSFHCAFFSFFQQREYFKSDNIHKRTDLLGSNHQSRG